MNVLLEHQAPYDWPAMLSFLSTRAIVGMEVIAEGAYSRSISLNGVHGTFSIRPAAANFLELSLDFPDAAAVPEIVARLRRMFDLDADLASIHRQLATDPLMARLIAERPGLRVPGAWDGLELAIRAVLGQQITVVAAIKLAGKLVGQYGEALDCAQRGLTHVFPEAAVLAAAELATLGMPKSRGRTLSGVAQALLDDPLLFDPQRAGGVARLLALHGIWRLDRAIHCLAAVARSGRFSIRRCRVDQCAGGVGRRAGHVFTVAAARASLAPSSRACGAAFVGLTGAG